ncbi:MAG: serine/threonine protein kinase, partial [Myxococcales bacterium]|nr:serine/threonine protein kinase [Myxococcales bacterium]
MSDGDAFGLVGTLFAEHYEVARCIAEGRTGLVYAARDARSGRDVALKVLRPALCENKDVVDAFLGEAEVASAIRHAAVVEILEVGATANGWIYVAMERIVGGEDLASYLRHTGPLPWSRVRPLGIQLCHAVDAGHRQGVIHRYLSTARCLRMVDQRDRERIKLLGFGVAGILPGGERSVASAPYAAPEQLAAAPLDRRVDVFAVGAILYELLTNQVPFRGETVPEICINIVNTEPTPLGELR